MDGIEPCQGDDYNSSMTPVGGRVALVTGANRGLGLETSRQLLAKGLTVVMAGRETRPPRPRTGELANDERSAR